MTSDVCIGLELVSENAIKKWREVIGPTNSTVAK
jgi:nucleoside diphosphate kinase